MPRLSWPSLRLTEADRHHLGAAAAVLGVHLTPAAIGDLCRFADLLDLWSSRMNLVSCRTARELVDRHFLDSLAVAAALPETGLVVDLGSGAGFPGLPLAILRTDLQFALVEVRRRRTSFLSEVRRTLKLKHVDVLEQRAEMPPHQYERAATAVVSRAVWADSSLLEISPRWLVDRGLLLWMRSDPLLPSDTEPFDPDSLLRYRIATDRPQCVHILRLR